MSGAATLIKHDLKITPWQVAALVATASGFNPFTSYVSNQIGRRHTMILASAFFLVGQLLMGLAPYYSTLLSGRLIASFGVSFTFMIVPIYAAEISPASSRGFLASFPEFFINVGVTLGYASNMVFSKLPLHLGWRLMLGVGAIPSVFLAVGFLFLPESPYWLVMKNRDDEARQVLRNISASEAEAASRLVDLQAAAGNGPRNDVVQVPTSGCCNLLKEFIPRPTRSVCHIFIAAVGLNFFQQATGIDAVVLYAPRILKKAGIKKGLRKPIITLVVGVVKTVFSVFPAFGLDRIGRRSFLLASIGGMFVSLVSLGLGLTMLDRTADRPVWAQVLCMITLAVYVASYSIGMGPITWLYTTEIVLYSLHVQGAGMGMLVNRVTSGSSY
ncbi:hypothetical protein L1049_014479 [Liquidambar formosana]|uniref:Major facilitator superfamily (MFS) profile domain-containing protein n=1 Tax=Liquidambar formosana TaxID=63359 RepID=A0AAP0S2T7_LIQFO